MVANEDKALHSRARPCFVWLPRPGLEPGTYARRALLSTHCPPKGTKRVDLALVRLAAGQSPRATIAEMLGTRGEVSHAVLVALVGVEKMCEMLQERLEAVVPAGSNAASRAACVLAIDAELDDLEGREEALIEASEEAGKPIPRRPDARMEIILGVIDTPSESEPDEVLPMPDSVKEVLRERARERVAENSQPVRSTYLQRTRQRGDAGVFIIDASLIVACGAMTAAFEVPRHRRPLRPHCPATRAIGRRTSLVPGPSGR